jgi:hypothetical protein
MTAVGKAGNGSRSISYAEALWHCFGRTGFPHVMRILRWLGQPAVAFTRIAAW